MTDDPVTSREELLRPLTFWEWISGVAGLAVYIAAIAATFYAAVWLISFASSLVRNLVG